MIGTLPTSGALHTATWALGQHSQLFQFQYALFSGRRNKTNFFLCVGRCLITCDQAVLSTVRIVFSITQCAMGRKFATSGLMPISCVLIADSYGSSPTVVPKTVKHGPHQSCVKAQRCKAIKTAWRRHLLALAAQQLDSSSLRKTLFAVRTLFLCKTINLCVCVCTHCLVCVGGCTRKAQIA